MTLPGREAVDRLIQNESRFDEFLNDPENYTTRTNVIVESVPHLMNRLQDLNNASQIIYKAPFSGAINISQERFNSQFYSVFNAMTDEQIIDITSGSFTLDVTTAIQTAIDAAASIGKFLYIPAGLYRLIPNTEINDEDNSYITKSCFLIRSGMHIYAEPNAIFKIANNVSTDSSPLSMACFASDSPIASFSILNLTIDMNGENNPISPLRPNTYRLYNQSPILISGRPGGTVAYADDVLIDNCVFKNNPGVCDIVMAQSNGVGSAIGRRWRIQNCKFLNNGLDTIDHTAVFAWADDVIFNNNFVINTTPFGTVGKTGGNTCYEIHGNNHTITNNTFRNYIRGVWVSSNYSSQICQNHLISNNRFETIFYGVDFFRTVSGLGKPTNTLINNNIFIFNSYTFSNSPQQKAAVNVSSEYSQGSISIKNNKAYSTDSVVGTCFLSVSPQLVANQSYDEIFCNNNESFGFTMFSNIRTNSTNSIKSLTLNNNSYSEPILTPTFATGIAFYVDATGAIKNLSISENNLLDTRTTSLLSYGLYFNGGSVNNFVYKPGLKSGVTVSEFIESLPVTYTTKDIQLPKISISPNFKFGGTPVTLNDGVSNGYYRINKEEVILAASLTIGSSTVIPSGSFSMSLPKPSVLSNVRYLGNFRIFDSSAGLFYTGICEIDGTSGDLVLQINGGGNASNTNPVALASGDIISVQITYWF